MQVGIFSDPGGSATEAVVLCHGELPASFRDVLLNQALFPYRRLFGIWQRSGAHTSNRV